MTATEAGAIAATEAGATAATEAGETANSAADPQEPRPRWLVTVLTMDALCGATVSGFGTPLIPEVARAHGISLEAATWVLTVTLIVGAVTIPVVSRLGDSGRRRLVLVATLGGIVCGSVLAAAWHTLPGLLAGRACQGLGYALVPLTISVAAQHLAGERLRRTLALISVSLAAGAGLANPLIGLFVRYLDYRAGFAFAALVAAFALACTLRVLPRGRPQPQPLGVDIAGAVLLGLGLGSGLLAVSRGVSWGWTSAPVLVLGAAAIVLLGWWLRVEWRRDRPLVDLRLASSPALLGVNLTAFCTGVAVFGGMSLVYRVIQAPVADHGLGRSRCWWPGCSCCRCRWAACSPRRWPARPPIGAASAWCSRWGR